MRYLKAFQMILAVFVIIILPFQISAQPKDLKGWNKAQWGMTEIELEYAFKGKIEKRPEPIIDKQDGIYVSLELHDFVFANAIFTVSFVMDDKTNQLKEVVLAPEETLFRMLFGILERQLVAKYGPVTKEDREDSDMQKMGEGGSGQGQIRRLWRFPSTTVTLKYWVYDTGSGKVSDGLALIFSKNAASKEKR